jgi:serine/threonine protein kinase/DNA-binding winged helix-turn-helix (wHTH) protein
MAEEKGFRLKPTRCWERDTGRISREEWRKLWEPDYLGGTLSRTHGTFQGFPRHSMKDTLPDRVRFGAFELDLKAGELRLAAKTDNAAESRIVLSEQPFRLLLMLVEREGAMVTREEIQKKFWPNDTIVEFDHSINVAIGKLRKALGDSADEPQYIATVARRGYRLMVPVERIAAAEDSPDEVGAHNAGGAGAGERMQPEPGVLTGRTVSHYRVLDIIGGGGMGVVYRAEDLKLGRRVALKFLPEELASDQVALQRFEREAQTASSLNHPNICTIHEVEEHEGQPFIVMELLEGDTLRDRLARLDKKSVSLDQLLDISIQIADGLDAAHRKGIIHRDIKPANIFLTTQGQVKILDFGLAKIATLATEIDAEEPRHLSAQTLEQPSGTESTLTRTGSAIGTAGYMSPEQVRSEKLDARTDLFSLGLVLYEMATGQRAFTGETAAIVHDAIVNQTPVPLRELNSTFSPKLERIIGKALEKDRALRYQSAAEMADDLRAVQQHTSTRSRASRWMLVGIAAVVLCAAVLLFLRFKPGEQGPTKAPTVRQLTPSSSDGPVIESISLSPDGKHLAYLDNAKGISLLQIDTGENRSLPDTTSFFPSSWLPDGDHLFVSKPGAPGTWTMSILDGTVRKFHDEAPLVPSPNGQQLAFKNNKDEIWIMSAAGESPKRVVSIEPQWSLGNFTWSPTGRRIAYDKCRVRGERSKSAAEIDVSLDSCDLSGHCSTLLSDSKLQARWAGESTTLVWLPDGRIVFTLSEPPPNYLDSNLWSLVVDPNTGRPQGEPKRLTSWTGSSQDAITASADGKRLVFQQVHPGSIARIAEIRPDGSGLGPARPLNSETWLSGEGAAWTTDSKTVLFTARGYGKIGIFKQDVHARSPQPLLSGASNYDTPVVSPDGKWSLYTEHLEDGTARLMRMPIESGPATLVLRGDYSCRCASAPATLCILSEVSGDQAIFSVLDPLKGRGRELARARINKGRYGWSLSPEGTNIALVVYGEDQVRIITTGGGDVRSLPLKGWNDLNYVSWTADGSRLYLSGAREFSADYPPEFAIFETDFAGNVKVLAQMSGAQGWFLSPVPSPDGRYLIYTERTWPSSVMMLENF